MNKSISISLFRVSGDSKYLDMIFSCPEEYYFTSLQLEARILENGKFNSQFYDLSPALFDSEESNDSEETSVQHRFVVRIPLDKLGIFVPAIYIGTFIAENAEDYSQDPITDTAVCSDVNYAYRCMIDELFMHQKAESCTDVIPDEVIRKYLLLYGHQAAMAARDFETAQEYFRLIGNCFENCGPKGRGSGSCCSGTCGGKHQFRPIHINPCNCGRP